MTENLETNISIEQKEIPLKEVWLVDDQENMIQSLLRFWGMKTSHLGYVFKYFKTGKEAVEEVEKRKQSREDLPAIIFMDGNLEKDEGDFQKGNNVIKDIRNIAEGEQIKIVAHSATGKMNEEMLNSGADVSFFKNDIVKSRDFLIEQVEPKD